MGRKVKSRAGRGRKEEERSEKSRKEQERSEKVRKEQERSGKSRSLLCASAHFYLVHSSCVYLVGIKLGSQTLELVFCSFFTIYLLF